jgi:DNA (cytosine-5)-methyltransferase 1
MGTEPFRVADLFCGAGGLSEGFRQAGFRIVAGNDADPDACATYALNFREARVVYGDVRRPDVREQLLAAAAGARVVIGGPPCQAFSQVRNHVRLIDDPRNSLYREFVRIVARLLPLAFVMENVPGLQQMGVKEQVLQDLTLDGAYRVSAQLLDAADFGVPQTRKRLVFVGLHRSLGVTAPRVSGSGATAALALERRNGSEPLHYRVVNGGLMIAFPPGDTQASSTGRVSDPLARLLDPEDAGLVTAGQALSDLDGLRAGTRADTLDGAALPPPRSAYQRALRAGLGQTIDNVSVPRINADTVLRLESIPPGGNYRDLPAGLTGRYLTGERWGPHNGSGRLGRVHYYAYRRLHPDLWSWTLNTKADAIYHYREARALSVREFARLQSFPDRFVFTTDPRPGALPGRIEGGASHSRYRQAGNAVPPLLARAVAAALLECLSSSGATRAAAGVA